MKYNIDDCLNLLEEYGKAYTTFFQVGKRNFYFSDRIKSEKYGCFRALKSYNSIVGFDLEDTHEILEVRRFSPTTSKQVTQFFNERVFWEDSYIRYQIEVNFDYKYKC